MGINPDAVALQPYSKDQVNYRHYQACKTCGYFNGRGKCSQVRGNISSEMACDKWVIQETSGQITGKEFITKEYEKSKVEVVK